MQEEQAREDLIQALNRLSTLPPEAGLPNLDGASQAEQESAFYQIEIGSLSLIFPAGVRAEAVSQPSIAPLPNASELLLGLINVRGDLVPIYQVHSLLAATPGQGSIVILFGTEAERVGLSVDRLPVRKMFRESEWSEYDKEEIPKALQPFVNGIFLQNSHNYYCLNVDKINEVLLDLASIAHASHRNGSSARAKSSASSKTTYPPSGVIP